MQNMRSCDFMGISRAKTTNLFSYGDLTEEQRQNIAVNTKEMKHGKTVLTSVPQRLVLELTNSCNLSCIMCGRTTKNFQATFFNFEWFKKLEPVMDRVTEMTLFGWGEPTVHPKFRQILEYLAQFPVKKYFLTNGMLVNSFDNLIVNTVDVLAISLDGANSSTNDKIRRGADFNRIIQNLRSLIDRRNASPQKRPYINFVMTLMKDNFHELPLLVKLAHAIGIEEVKAVYLTSFSKKMASQVLFNMQTQVKKVFENALDLGERYNILVKLPYLQGNDPAEMEPHKPCFVGWRDFFVGSDGFVRPCQSTPQKFFNIQEYSDFMDMWNAQQYQTFRKTVNQIDSTTTQCSNCYQSSYANWNRRTSFLQNEVSSEFAPEWL
ncbi:radical SAM protein [bacterium]|nr:radical SAM protein [bacterium]